MVGFRYGLETEAAMFILQCDVITPVKDQSKLRGEKGCELLLSALDTPLTSSIIVLVIILLLLVLAASLSVLTRKEG